MTRERGSRPGRRVPGSMSSSELAVRVGEHIRASRQALGWSQQQLAKAIDADPPEISRYEHGKRMPSAETIRRLCLALSVSADRLLELPHA